MNRAAALLRECEAAGVEFRATAQGLRIRDSRRRLTAERRELIRQWEPALLEYLRKPPAATAEPTERQQEAARVWELLQARGWVRIDSRVLGAEVLLLREDRFPVPERYADLVTFTLPELQGLDRDALQQLHAQRATGAILSGNPATVLLEGAALRTTLCELFVARTAERPEAQPPR
jgi:hypothetical protein